MYPVCPASGEYALGTPLFEKATISFPDGKNLLITAPGTSSERRYVRRVAQDGKVTDGRFIKFSDLRKGGVLTFEMSAEPERGETLTGVRP
jgi:putative alpha-1,2-mannosidase